MLLLSRISASSLSVCAHVISVNFAYVLGYVRQSIKRQVAVAAMQAAALLASPILTVLICAVARAGNPFNELKPVASGLRRSSAVLGLITALRERPPHFFAARGSLLAFQAPGSAFVRVLFPRLCSLKSLIASKSAAFVLRGARKLTSIAHIRSLTADSVPTST